MADEVSFTIILAAPLASRLTAAAAEHGWSSESLAAECVAQRLEVAIRHRVLIERAERIDAALLDMAQAVGELGAPSGAIDLTKVCRFRAKDGTGAPAA
ncbi:MULTISPECIES: hypothetical protein [Methylobacterium]|jgi:hypothetical protein|uniref:Uncharacterized protein n=2 Tax=Methylobacterium TaxID=407 RepID=A0AAJ1WY99_9HYPH|nr:MULTISPECIES: hypothetical protein [Methylobacterium]KOX43585.1 hypothetical protein ADL19_27835 [Streptomyces purpurogeneiscleroticus]MCB4806312.1 hypothetical protein [Methylobacterium brachiatum]MCJ2011677.1 hypothetical protein [Methylobacterium sp. J-076]MDQ0444881.1 hypothetical protein [Methylobacterium persicinum]MDQ0547409.1 hypothetical protein [Methylobacterium brachiatum]